MYSSIEKFNLKGSHYKFIIEMTSLKTENLCFEEKQLYVPELEEIKNGKKKKLPVKLK